MAKKRFTDIEIWDKEWYMELTPKHKCLMKYMFDKCDACGCWKPNWKLASLHINEAVNLDDLKALPKDQYEVLETGKIFIPDFVEFQYGQLSLRSPAHNPVFLALEKNNLLHRVLNRLSNSLQEKEKDKEKEKDMEMDKGGAGGKINSDFVCYNAEDFILTSQLEFEKICMVTGKPVLDVKKELHKYHLWMEKNEKYPIGKKAALAGVESWILNDYKNGQQSLNGSSKLGTSEARIKTARTW